MFVLDFLHPTHLYKEFSFATNNVSLPSSLDVNNLHHILLTKLSLLVIDLTHENLGNRTSRNIQIISYSFLLKLFFLFKSLCMRGFQKLNLDRLDIARR
jgi:hypothetical protein